jgi:hypothetical protein
MLFRGVWEQPDVMVGAFSDIVQSWSAGAASNRLSLGHRRLRRIASLCLE